MGYMSKKKQENLEQIIALAKRRGFIYQSSEIYGGIAGMWDYGPHGVALKENIKRLWRKRFVEEREDMCELDTAIMMNPKTWEASGHLEGFADPLVKCQKCKQQFRADHADKACPECGGQLGDVERFNMMFATHVGARADSSALAYLRPETAQGIFVNFKNIIDSFHPKLPFGIAQIGKAFRNEISPRDFIFRAREFEQMEAEYFVRPEEWEKHFTAWREIMVKFLYDDLGLSRRKVHEREIPKQDRAHYSLRTIDFEFDYPFGTRELCGLAYRTDYDLARHAALSGTDMSYLVQESGERFIPHVIEPSLGVDRLVLAALADAYREDEMDGERRVFLAISPEVAPVRAAVFPLLKNKPELVARAREIYGELRKEVPRVAFDDNGNIGKRYRRQDEIGTPHCITVDFDTLADDTVTIRARDTGTQERVAVKEIRRRLA